MNAGAAGGFFSGRRFIQICGVAGSTFGSGEGLLDIFETREPLFGDDDEELWRCHSVGLWLQSLFLEVVLGLLAPRTRIERATCPLGGGCSIH